jgi:hypothetical protein
MRRRSPVGARLVWAASGRTGSPDDRELLSEMPFRGQARSYKADGVFTRCVWPKAVGRALQNTLKSQTES